VGFLNDDLQVLYLCIISLLCVTTVIEYYAFLAQCMCEMNTYRAAHVCPHDSIYEPLDGHGCNLVWKLCHWGLLYNLTFQFPAFSNTNMADEQTCEVRSTLSATSNRAIQ
jgi:hypothetical protein